MKMDKNKFLPKVALPRENPFRAISQMARTSFGKLPAHLVIIFMLALVAAVLCGLFLKIIEKPPRPRDAYLVREIKPETDKPALADNQLRGMWAYQAGDHLLTLEMGNGAFELLLRYPDAPKVRYFIRGGYRVEGNVLILQNRKDLGSPFDETFAVKYYPLQFSTLNVYATKNGNVMTWSVPLSQQNRLKSPGISLFDAPQSPIGWLRIGDAR